MWWFLACGPAELVLEADSAPLPFAAGAGDRLWWSEGDGVTAVDPTDGRVWGRWEGPVDGLAADRSGVWLASGHAVVRLDSAATEQDRWGAAARPRVVADGDGAWVGWSDGALWRCTDAACRRSTWVGTHDGLAPLGDHVLTFDAAAAAAIDPTRPEPLWSVAGHWVAGVVARDTVALVDVDGSVTGVDAADGAARWTTPDDVVVAPVAVGGWVVVASADTVTALGAASGGPRWWRPRQATRTLAAGPDWTVAAWDGTTAEIVDVASGDPLGTLRSDTPPVALPCGWATVVDGDAACYRW